MELACSPTAVFARSIAATRRTSTPFVTAASSPAAIQPLLCTSACRAVEPRPVAPTSVHPCKNERWRRWSCPPHGLSLQASNQGPTEPERETSMIAIRILAATLGLLASTAAFADDPLPRAKPEDVGLSSERLARIGETLKADIAAGPTPRAVTAPAPPGKLVAFTAPCRRAQGPTSPIPTPHIFYVA